MAGLAVIALLFPDLPGAARWESRAVSTLSTEADNLILADGCGAEQSVGYQIATVELLLLVAALLVQRDGRAPSGITGAISRSSAFLAAVVGEDDPDPRYGDADQNSRSAWARRTNARYAIISVSSPRWGWPRRF